MTQYLKFAHKIRMNAFLEVGKRVNVETKVSLILRQNEVFKQYDPCSPIKCLFANQVGAHTPIQDAWAEATSLHTPGYMFGVFDGNSGITCSHVLAKRIFKYLTVPLLPRDILEEYSNSLAGKKMDILSSHQDKYFFLEEYEKPYRESLQGYIKAVLETEEEERTDPLSAMESSFLRLDEDMSREAMEDTTPARRLLWAGITGSGATVVHIDGHQVTLGTAGDALTVIGTKDATAKVLTPEHNVENKEEVQRILGEHPGEKELLKDGLLLGSLTAFRSFGNFRYKWTRDVLEKVLGPRYGTAAIPANSQSPPYLTARPDVTKYTLTSDDMFMVIATDGIWDIFPPKKVVELICGHRPPAHWVLSRLKAPLKKLNQVRAALNKESLKSEGGGGEGESSPATYLIREALGASFRLLHLPDSHYVRNVRDDMTVLILYFNQDYLKNLDPLSSQNLNSDTSNPQPHHDQDQITCSDLSKPK